MFSVLSWQWMNQPLTYECLRTATGKFHFMIQNNEILFKNDELAVLQETADSLRHKLAASEDSNYRLNGLVNQLRSTLSRRDQEIRDLLVLNNGGGDGNEEGKVGGGKKDRALLQENLKLRRKIEALQRSVQEKEGQLARYMKNSKWSRLHEADLLEEEYLTEVRRLSHLLAEAEAKVKPSKKDNTNSKEDDCCRSRTSNSAAAVSPPHHPSYEIYRHHLSPRIKAEDEKEEEEHDLSPPYFINASRSPGPISPADNLKARKIVGKGHIRPSPRRSSALGRGKQKQQQQPHLRGLVMRRNNVGGDKQDGSSIGVDKVERLAEQQRHQHRVAMFRALLARQQHEARSRLRRGSNSPLQQQHTGGGAGGGATVLIDSPPRLASPSFPSSLGSMQETYSGSGSSDRNKLISGSGSKLSKRRQRLLDQARIQRVMELERSLLMEEEEEAKRRSLPSSTAADLVGHRIGGSLDDKEKEKEKVDRKMETFRQCKTAAREKAIHQAKQAWQQQHYQQQQQQQQQQKRVVVVRKGEEDSGKALVKPSEEAELQGVTAKAPIISQATVAVPFSSSFSFSSFPISSLPSSSSSAAVAVVLHSATPMQEEIKITTSPPPTPTPTKKSGLAATDLASSRAIETKERKESQESNKRERKEVQEESYNKKSMTSTERRLPMQELDSLLAELLPTSESPVSLSLSPSSTSSGGSRSSKGKASGASCGSDSKPKSSDSAAVADSSGARNLLQAPFSTSASQVVHDGSASISNASQEEEDDRLSLLSPSQHIIQPSSWEGEDHPHDDDEGYRDVSSPLSISSSAAVIGSPASSPSSSSIDGLTESGTPPRPTIDGGQQPASSKTAAAASPLLPEDSLTYSSSPSSSRPPSSFYVEGREQEEIADPSSLSVAPSTIPSPDRQSESRKNSRGSSITERDPSSSSVMDGPERVIEKENLMMYISSSDDEEEMRLMLGTEGGEEDWEGVSEI